MRNNFEQALLAIMSEMFDSRLIKKDKTDKDPNWYITVIRHLQFSLNTFRNFQVICNVQFHVMFGNCCHGICS